MTNRPPFDPRKDEILRKIAADPCYAPSLVDIAFLDSEPYFEPQIFTPPPRPRFTQLSLFDVE